MLIAAFDISMTATGCVLVNMPDSIAPAFHLCEAEVAETKKGETFEKVSSTVDGLRRAKHIHETVKRFLDEKPNLVVIEAMSWPRNAASAIKMALAWGSLAPLLTEYPLIEVGPQDIKIACALKRSATKEEVEAGVKARALANPAASIEVLENAVPKRALREHCWDAMGAVYAATKTQKFSLLRVGMMR